MHTEAHDALVNLKKYIRDCDGEPIGRVACIQLIDEFIKKAVLPPAPAVYHVKEAPDGAIYIGRKNALSRLETSPYHNPFVIGEDGTREEVLAKFEEYWYAPKQTALRAQAYVELLGKNLSCWCKRAKKPLACHGDIILAFLDAGQKLEKERAGHDAYIAGPKCTICGHLIASHRKRQQVIGQKERTGLQCGAVDAAGDTCDCIIGGWHAAFV